MHKTNYHTHTVRCHHAVGADRDYFDTAVRAGYTVLGMSDHAPYPYLNGYRAPGRMQMEETGEYLSTMVALRAAYRDRLTVYIGFECEALPDYKAHLAELKSRCDYLVMGHHGNESTGEPFYGCVRTPEQVRKYTREVLAGMEWGLFDCLAHPEVCLASYPVWDDAAQDMALQITRAARALHMPLEYNLFGVYKQTQNPQGLGYPYFRFWEAAAREGCDAILGVDAHDPARLTTPDYEAADRYLRSLGLNVIRCLPGLEAKR